MTTRPADENLQHKIRTIIAKGGFATLSTTSPAGFPHAAGVVYEEVDSTLWIHTSRESRKARNIEANAKAAIVIPFRRVPAGPPFTIQFQAHADLVAMDDPRITELIEAKKLRTLTSHGELNMAAGTFIAIEPRGTITSFGPGARLVDIIRDPIGSGSRAFRWTP